MVFSSTFALYVHSLPLSFASTFLPSSPRRPLRPLTHAVKTHPLVSRSGIDSDQLYLRVPSRLSLSPSVDCLSLFLPSFFIICLFFTQAFIFFYSLRLFLPLFFFLTFFLSHFIFVIFFFSFSASSSIFILLSFFFIFSSIFLRLVFFFFSSLEVFVFL